MTPLSVSASTTIIKQGEVDATKFYVLESGKCEVYLFNESWAEERLVHTYHPGSGFGELALLYSAPRAATVKAVMACKLWVMERSVYSAVKHNFDQQMIQQRQQLVEKVPLLQMLSEDHKAILAEALEMVDFQHDQRILNEQEVGDKFFIIREGNVNVTKQGNVIDKLGPGDYFGERALIQDDKRAASVVAQGYVVCYTLSRQNFNNILGPIEVLWRYEVLKKVPILFNLSDRQAWSLAQQMQPAHFKANEVVLRKGDEGDTFYVIEDGLFSIFDENKCELARVGKGSCFGELALLRRDVRAANVVAIADSKGEQGDRFYIVESGIVGVFKDGCENPLVKLGPTSYFGELSLLRNDKRAASVICLTNVTVLSLNRAGFDELLGPLQQIMQTQASSYDAVTSNKLGTQVKLEDLKKHGVLGTGGFGRVLLVSHCGKFYALKCMSKAYVKESNLQDHVKRERDIMLELQCPFIVNLLATFKDTYTVYMLMESIMGGELFTYLQKRRKPLSENHARFYAACVIGAFEYLQERHLVYRDLKPENLLINVDGYLKVTDFGFAKKMPTGGKTYTLCGTPEYLAPELVTQTGHNHAADWWAVGVLIYELVTGRPPFYDDDRVKMFKKICDVKFSFPQHVSEELRDLIKRLLMKKPAMRLGAQKNGASDVKAHAWFKGFNWPAFERQELQPPYLPKVAGPGDASNFVIPADANTHPAMQQPKRYVSTGVFKDF